MNKLSLAGTVAGFLAFSAIAVGCSSSGGSGGSNGGATSTGGKSTETGGAGGASASGGAVSSGGSGAGGAASGGSGGGSTAGGAQASGGAVSAGGATAGAGGGVSSGGSVAAGGATAKGGTNGTGGVSSTGGGSSAPTGASGYPAAGASGQAKPTGSASTVTVLPWAGFKGAVSFTFDDANQTQIDNYSELQAQNDKGNNVRYTFYVITGKSTMSNSVWAQAIKDGHELTNHTKSHIQTGDVATLTADTEAAETYLKSTFGVTAYSLAAPYGTTTYQSVAVGKFLTNRGVNDGTIAMTDNPDNTATPSSSLKYNLPCYIPGAGAPASTLEGAITAAVSVGKWKTMLVHGFTANPQSDGAYLPVDIKEFTATVAWAKAQGNIWLDTVANVSAYWIAGYKFSKLTPTTSGSDKTWTWKTSDFSDTFPPGHYLRVKTDGGTLKQGNTTLAWDDHGYYEVSLDAGTLTLSP